MFNMKNIAIYGKSISENNLKFLRILIKSLIKELDAGTLVNPSHHFGDVLISKFDFPFIKIELLI